MAPGQSLTETVTIGTPNALNITGKQTGTATTNAEGQFTDTFYVCSAVCPSNTGSTAATQTISDVYQAKTYALTPNALVYSCSAITVNGK